MLNVVALMGRLVYEPELKTTQNGTNVCSFRIAVDRSFARQGEERKADFIDVTAWRQTAEFVSKYFHKGSMIAIEGSLQTRQYQDKNGNNCTATEVLASQVSFCGGKAAEKPGVRDFDQQTKKSCARSKRRSQRPAEASERAGVFAGQCRRLFGHRRQRRPPVLSRERRYLTIRAFHSKGGQAVGIDPSRGFVAIPRGLTDWEWYSEPNTTRLFIHLLLTSNWQEKQWQGITIHPGELVTSRAKLAKQLRMSEQSVRTALMHLQSTNCITSKTGPRYSVIAINNYTEIIGSTKQSTSNQPTPNQDLTKITKKTRQSSSACATPESTPTKTPSPVVMEFEQRICKLSTQGKAQLTGYADRLGEELVLAIISRCADLGAYSWVYVRKALEETKA